MKAINRDIVREIKKTKSKFLSLIVIIFLGVFVFVGIKETSPTMLNTVNNYFTKVNMYDLKVKNSFLLSKEDISLVTQYENIAESEEYYELTGKEDKYSYSIDIQSLPENIAKPVMKSGNLPTNATEILLTESLIEKYNIGDTVKISYTNDNIKLQNNEFTVVGFAYGVDRPENSTNNPGNSSYFAYVPKGNFVSDVVSGLNITLKNIKRNDFTVDSYYEQVNVDRDKLLEILAKQQAANDKKFKENNETAWQKGKDTLDNMKQQLAEAGQGLEQFKEIEPERYARLVANIANNKEQLAKQEEELAINKERLANINYPAFKVENIQGNAQYKQFIASSNSLVAIANIFSVFLFAVALLVSLTTITRMIDENRINVGTLKSLGYANGQIYKKYYLYGLLSAIIGAILGTVGAYQIVLPIVYDAYARLLTLKEPVVAPNIVTIISAFTLAILCVVCAVYVPLSKILKEKSAYLLRPKAPKNGSRILLEYLPFIWQRLSFLRKVTFRNIFRYKVRMLMTIFGVLGCLSLMFIGFGIRFGVMNVSNEQFKVISKFDIIATYNPYITNSEKDRLYKQIMDTGQVEQLTQININNATIEENNEVLDTVPVVAIAKDQVKDYITLKQDKEAVDLTDDGVVINEKLAYLHKLAVGDKLPLVINEQKYNLTVTAISDNYFGHTAYISKDYYEKIFGKEYSYNSCLIKAYKDAEKVDNIVKTLDTNSNVVFVQDNVKFQNLLDNFIAGIDIIVVVLVLCSLALALVVLYNLININISERLRELSTIKVLGFYASEVTTYVFREIFYLAALGVTIGNVVGYLLYRKIILDLAAREMMFSSVPSIWVYIISSGITFIIVFVVMIIMHRRLRKVNMVEALKAVE